VDYERPFKGKFELFMYKSNSTWNYQSNANYMSICDLSGKKGGIDFCI
jgi:hypothetical protein